MGLFDALFSEQGEDWCGNPAFPDCCGQRQSPIDIDTGNVMEDPNIPPLVTNQYTYAMKGVVENSGGHTLKFSPRQSPEADAVGISGGPLPPGETFRFGQLHLHWGERNASRGPGSEHRVDGIQ